MEATFDLEALRAELIRANTASANHRSNSRFKWLDVQLTDCVVSVWTDGEVTIESADAVIGLDDWPVLRTIDRHLHPESNPEV